MWLMSPGYFRTLRCTCFLSHTEKWQLKTGSSSRVSPSSGKGSTEGSGLNSHRVGHGKITLAHTTTATGADSFRYYSKFREKKSAKKKIRMSHCLIHSPLTPSSSSLSDLWPGKKTREKRKEKERERVKSNSVYKKAREMLGRKMTPSVRVKWLLLTKWMEPCVNLVTSLFSLSLSLFSSLPFPPTLDDHLTQLQFLLFLSLESCVCVCDLVGRKKNYTREE